MSASMTRPDGLGDDGLCDDERVVLDGLRAKGLAEGSVTSYGKHFAQFERWAARQCDATGDGRPTLPASPETVAVYLYDHAVEEARWTAFATADAHVCAIRWAHRRDQLPDPTDSDLVRGLTAHLRALLGTAPQQQRTPARPADALQAMSATGAGSKRRRSGSSMMLSRTRAALHVARALQVSPLRVELLCHDNVTVTAEAIRLPVFGSTRGLVPGQSVWLPAAEYQDLIDAVTQWMAVSAAVAPRLAFNQPQPGQSPHAVGYSIHQAVRISARNAGIPVEEQQRPWTWTDDEFDHALECVDPAWREHRRTGAYLLVGLGLALRDASLRSIMRAGVTWAGDYYRVEVPHYKHGHGALVRAVHHTGGHPPTCPACALERWLAVRGDQPGPLFTAFDRHSATGRVVSQKSARKALVTFMEDAGLQGRWGTHSLRRGFVSAAVDAGMPPQWIQGVTYHRSIDEILRYFDEADLQSLPSPLDAA